MSSAPRPPSIDRLLDLLADRATQGLSPAENSELAGLLAKWPHIDEEALDRAAAALTLSTVEPSDVPPSLRDRLDRDAEQFFAPRPTQKIEPPAWLPRVAAWSGWLVAATLLLALWLRTPSRTASVAEQLALLRQEPGTQVLTGKAIHIQNAAGMFVWNGRRQEGFMVIEHVPVNDPSKSQYQLWIVDGSRGAVPVDGGVFDVSVEGEAVVPIVAKLPVRDPQAFLITEEPPGGVVVSDRKVQVLLATAGGN